MLPNSTAVTLVQNFLRAQQGLVEVAKPTSADQLLVTVGERVQATVTDQLPNGRFAVLIKDQLLDLNLPRNTQPGDQLELTVVAKEPKLTFGLSDQTPAPKNQASSTGVALSQTGKMLGELLVRSDGQGKAANVQQAQPLFEGKPQPAQLASQLASRLAESGLFYESHQAEWVTGDRSLQTLLREPQARLLSPEVDQGNQAQSKEVRDTSSHSDSSLRLPVQFKQPAETVQQSTRVISDARLTPDQLQHPEQAVRHLVQQQLELVENHPLIWQGQAWPGQPLRWALELENERQADAPETEPSRVWQTRLDLDLPRLGAVAVTANMRDGQFSLRFEAKNPETVGMLQINQQVLAERFAAAGLTLASSLVQPHVDEAQS